MKILFLANHLDVGGISSYLLTLSSGLVRRGHHAHLACAGGSQVSRFISFERTFFIPVATRTKAEFNPLRLARNLGILTRYVRQKDIEIIHSNTRVTQVLGELLSRVSGISHVSTCHGFFRKSALRTVFPCWGWRTIAISRQVAEHLVQDLGVQEKNVRIIHNGIDFVRFSGSSAAGRKAFRRVLGLEEAPLVGIIARLSDVKGHLYLIEAMQAVRRRFSDVRLLIVGEGKMEMALRKKARELGLEECVIFMPKVPDTAEALAAMDVFVLPSLQEGLGLSLMEAMASGLAVVASSVGGIPDLLRHNENGLLVEPGNTEALAASIQELLGDASKRRSLGNAARAFMQENFSQERMCLETERVYLECLREKSL